MDGVVPELMYFLIQTSEEETLEFVDTIQEYLDDARMFSEVVTKEDDNAEAGGEAGARTVLQELLSNSAGESQV